MKAFTRLTGQAAIIVLFAVLAAACAGPPTVKTAVGQQETIAAAVQAVGADVSPATRVAAYCAIEQTAVESLRPFRQPKNPPNVGEIADEAASLAVTVFEVAPDEIAEALRVQRSVIGQIDRALTEGTYDVIAYGRSITRFTTRTVAFLNAVAEIAAFDREVCGIA
ncbi:MAG: hypothetical protein ACRDJ1_04740 [Actinomycetota bacterium]